MTRPTTSKEVILRQRMVVALRNLSTHQ